MKKIQQTDLRLEKEVIPRLSADDLTYVKGGADSDLCLLPNNPADCKTIMQYTCQVILECDKTENGHTCMVQMSVDYSCDCIYSAGGNCKPPVLISAEC